MTTINVVVLSCVLADFLTCDFMGLPDSVGCLPMYSTTIRHSGRKRYVWKVEYRFNLPVD
jgi:hypothetical protein